MTFVKDMDAIITPESLMASPVANGERFYIHLHGDNGNIFHVNLNYSQVIELEDDIKKWRRAFETSKGHMSNKGTVLDEDIIVSDKRFRVVVHFMHEGLNGDWNESDEYDIPLVRFSCYYNLYLYDIKPETETDEIEWEPFKNDLSFCTTISAKIDKKHYVFFAERILAELNFLRGKIRRNENIYHNIGDMAFKWTTSELITESVISSRKY